VADTAGLRPRRDEVERLLGQGDVTGLRDLATRLQAAGITVTPDELRADVRALGAVRVRHGDSAVLALPLDGSAARRPADAGLTAEIAADPDWPIQLGVVAVVAVFLLVGLLGWLISA
jgi:hypothetical protein